LHLPFATSNHEALRFQDLLGTARNWRQTVCIDFQSALKALQNLIAPQEFGSIRVEVQSAANEGTGEAQSSSARHFAFFIVT